MPVTKFADWLSMMPERVAGLPVGSATIYDIFQTFVLRIDGNFL